MNKIIFTILILCIFINISCESDISSNGEQLESLIENVNGVYRLEAAVSDTALDFNGDGIANTDLFVEAFECQNSLVFNSYYCFLRHRSNYEELDVEVPLSEYRPHLTPNSCLRDKSLVMPYDYDVENNNIFLVANDHWEDFNASFRSKILDVDWQNQWVYVTVETEHYDAQGNWTTVVLYLSYEKFSNQS